MQDPSLENESSQAQTKSYHADPRSKEPRYKPEAEDDRCLDVCGEYLEEEGVDAAEAALKRDGLDACVETCVQDQVLGYHEIKLGNSFVPFEYDLTPQGFRSSNGQYLSEILENSNGLEREYIENLLEIERKILSGETTQAFLVSREPGSNTPVIYSYTVDPENKNKIRANTIIMWGGETELSSYLGALGKQTGINTADLYDGAVVMQDSENLISDQDMFQAGYEALSQNATVKVQGGDPFRDQIAQQKETVATLRSAYKQYLAGAGSEQEQLERVKKLATLHADAVSEIMEILNIGSKDLPASFDKADMLDRITLLVEGIQDPRHSVLDRVQTKNIEKSLSEKMTFMSSAHTPSPRYAFGRSAPRGFHQHASSPVSALSKGASESVGALASNPVSSPSVTYGRNTTRLSNGRTLNADSSRRSANSQGVRGAREQGFARPSKPLGLRGRDRFLADAVTRGQKVTVKPDIEEKSRENALDKELKQRLQREVEVPQVKISEMIEEVEGHEQLKTEESSDYVVEPTEDLQQISEELDLDDDIKDTDPVTLEPTEIEDKQDLTLEGEVADEEFLIEARASEEQQDGTQESAVTKPVTVDEQSIDLELSHELAEIESLFEEELRVEEEQLLDTDIEEQAISEADDTEQMLLDEGVESSGQVVNIDRREAEGSLLTDVEAEELELVDDRELEPVLSVMEEDIRTVDPTSQDMVEATTAADEVAFLESIDEGAYSDEIIFEADNDVENTATPEGVSDEQLEERVAQGAEEMIDEEEILLDALSEEEDLELESQIAEPHVITQGDKSEAIAESSRLADQVEEVTPSVQHRETRIRLLRRLHELALEQELELEEFMKKHRRYKKRKIELDFLIYRLLFELEISDEFREYLMQEGGFSEFELEQLLQLLLKEKEHLNLSSALVQRLRSFRLRNRNRKHEPLLDKVLMQ